MDSSSVTDPSPGPSPESPVAKVAPSSFVADFRSRRTDHGSSDSSPNTFFELQRPTTPAKKPRNLKNLGINTSTSLSNLRANPTGSLPLLATKEKNTSAPTSPSFIKPPTPPKRRPSNLSLTIQTPGSDSKPMRLVIPSTPAVNRPTLRHFQSSPSLPLCSPSAAVNGGMKLPPLRPLKTNPHGFAEVPFEQEEEEDDQEPNFDIPQSREEKPAAYPNGPICIYESGVYLYFEPTAEQATNFDVIVNVASEVKNPFTNTVSESQKDLDARRVDGPPAESVNFASLPERPTVSSFDPQNSSPTTPKATPTLQSVLPGEQMVNGTLSKTPEYIHMPWEHNTDIVPDLYKLVKIMDDRVKQGKRVLVHCQCGVSRSASLIVAYGLYKNPGISVQEAYDAVKKRSKWIGPNMNLIMQLQEFRNGLLRANESRTHNQGYGFPRRSAGLSTGVSAGTSRHSPFDRQATSGPRTPRTAPLPPETDMNMQRASTGNMIAISPGPLSAPSGAFFSPDYRRSWASSQTHFDLSPKSSPTATPYVDPKGHVIPMLSITDNDRLPPAKMAPTNGVPQQMGDSNNNPVPNFSRQLPFRTLPGNAIGEVAPQTVSQSARVGLSVPAQPPGFGALRSPAAATFNIPPLAPFGDHSSDARADESSGPPMSQRNTEFHMTSLNSVQTDSSLGVLSPCKASFDLGPQRQCEPEEFQVASPIRTDFPRDPWAHRADPSDRDWRSPRAAEFHMTPLKPSVPADEDPFGLTSPTRFEFPTNPFASAGLSPPLTVETEDRRPSFQAILPPSHLQQPESVNGFASLNSTAQPNPRVPLSTPSAMQQTLAPSDAAKSNGGDVELETKAMGPVETAGQAGPEAPPSKTPEQSLLSTPQRPSTLRTRFSSPNMREQRRLQKLQTEMEALLPNRSLRPPQALDDLDALMSPRAEEFTRNPFHFELRSPVDDTSPASSNDTITDNKSRVSWKEPLNLTPHKVAEDPRSPVQAGSSPIVRNIWDVL
ncbi:uncharacterized protein EI97DRAFT_380333 [Westerdykella ornata]|uniref:protein-tyrosine-phosphatase n=1 Tax=Westerdykella ornata TaxID=318751 RepID=A0A6A6JG24_WESOR|nr:uncharacterized protein EI97DRAFT_380333 [Westerdykella ornata]KAF2275103.1 hypothetical protein EI97DRAFT_380333 [Westerdykella ornata]